jgi:hypothetical protein
MMDVSTDFCFGICCKILVVDAQLKWNPLQAVEWKTLLLHFK